jgi:hypothetical protein
MIAPSSIAAYQFVPILKGLRRMDGLRRCGILFQEPRCVVVSPQMGIHDLGSHLRIRWAGRNGLLFEDHGQVCSGVAVFNYCDGIDFDQIGPLCCSQVERGGVV